MKTKTPPPFDFAKELDSMAYRSKGKHEAAAMSANDKGNWIVTPHSRLFEGRGADKKARAYFESLRPGSNR